MTDVPHTQELAEADVASWLEANPEFLFEHLNGLEPESEADSDSSPTSIAFYQVRALREKNTRLQQQLKELVRVAGENEALIGRLHELTLALLSASSLDELIVAIADGMVNQFSAPHSLLFMIQPVEAEHEVLAPQAHTTDVLAKFADMIKQGEPLCGRIGAKKLQSLFPDVESPLASAALIPMPGMGLLALGAPDDDKFQPGMETDFLRLLGNMISAALSRHLESSATVASRSAS